MMLSGKCFRNLPSLGGEGTKGRVKEFCLRTLTLPSPLKGEDAKVKRIKASSESHQKGFTLLELIISISLIGIMVLIIAGALRLASRSIESAEAKIASLERSRASVSIIGSQIESYIPLTYDHDGERKFYFTGEGSSVTFSTNYSIWGGQKGYVVVTYESKANEQGTYDLHATENTVGMEGMRETMLFDSLDNIYFEYFFKGPTDEFGTWTARWEEEATVPEKIRIHLVKGVDDLVFSIPLRVGGTAQDLAEEGFSVEEE
jgi:general secretion pathway protein J